MQELRPTMMASVPRLYEKIYARVLDSVRAELAREAADLRVGPARGRGLGRADARGRRRSRRRWRCSGALADRLVFAKLRARTGGRIRFFISGGAPLSPEIAKFFFAAGMPILEGYGLTETSPVMAVNTFGHTQARAPSAGRSRTSRSGSRPDGEIVTRGPNVMRGYFEKPEATAEAIDAGGLVPHRRHRACSTPTATSRSPTARRI